MHEPNITAWRRAVCGDLTSAFDFSRPNDRRLALPDTSDAVARMAAALKLPKPIPPATGALSAQEPGHRPSRALHYAPLIEETIDNGTLRLSFGNGGKAGSVYQVHDLDDLDALPRHYTVEPGKTLTGDWPIGEQGYRLQVRGPNRWFRELHGAASDMLSVRCRATGDTLRIELVNRGKETIALQCRNLLSGAAEFHMMVPPNGATWAVPIGAADGWYDVALVSSSGSPLLRRLSGRVETGRDSISRPASRAAD